MTGEANTVRRGDVFCEAAYAQSKMLCNSSWSLPRLITPSDIDLVFDNRGEMMLCELSRHHQWWSQLNKGQRVLYEELARKGCLCVLLNHSVPPTRQIDTRNNINTFAFCLMDGRDLVASPPQPGHQWPGLIESKWFHCPQYVWRRARELSQPSHFVAPVTQPATQVTQKSLIEEPLDVFGNPDHGWRLA